MQVAYCTYTRKDETIVEIYEMTDLEKPTQTLTHFDHILEGWKLTDTLLVHTDLETHPDIVPQYSR